MKTLASIVLIGEMFKLKIVQPTYVHKCITNLLKDKLDEDNLENVCRLLEIAGKDLQATVKKVSSTDSALAMKLL